MVICRLLIFFKIIFFEKVFQEYHEYHQSVKQFEFISQVQPFPGLFVRPDLVPNCLRKLSPDNTVEQAKIRVNILFLFKQLFLFCLI